MLSYVVRLLTRDIMSGSIAISTPWFLDPWILVMIEKHHILDADLK